MSQEVVSYYEDFSEIEKKIWDLLTNAVTDRSSEFRTPVFICGDDKDLEIKKFSDIADDGAPLGCDILCIEYLCISRLAFVTAPGLKTPREVCLSLCIKFSLTLNN